MPRAKRWPNESGLREPLIVSWPGRIADGTTSTDLVHTMDLAPTMLALAGLEIPEWMHGVPLFNGDGALRADSQKMTFGGRDRQGEAEDRSRTVRDARFRYIRNHFPDKPAMIHTEYPDRLPTWAAFRRLASDECQQRARGERPSAMTDVQRAVVAQSKPHEELYDILTDPHETVDLAADPRFAEDLDRLRRALDDWTERFGDLGAMPESELEELWRPGGVRRRTDPPRVAVSGGALTLATPAEGVRLGWTRDAPVDESTESPLQQEIGGAAATGRRWTPYTEPVPLDAPVWVRSWRIGFEPSAETLVEASARS
jgi:N-sulfoglucosamine sulfohydrolase